MDDRSDSNRQTALAAGRKAIALIERQLAQIEKGDGAPVAFDELWRSFGAYTRALLGVTLLPVGANRLQATPENSLLTSEESLSPGQSVDGEFERLLAISRGAGIGEWDDEGAEEDQAPRATMAS